MGRRGPAPTPTALKLLKGAQPCRINKNEPVARDGFPVCPEGTDEAVREIWDYAISEMIAMGTAKSADRDTLRLYCEAVVAHRRASEVVNAEPLIVEGATGGMVRNPALVIQRDAAEQVRKLAQEFGFTPSARSRITVEGRAGAEPDNPFAANG